MLLFGERGVRPSTPSPFLERSEEGIGLAYGIIRALFQRLLIPSAWR